jgi:hypothetical protein
MIFVGLGAKLEAYYRSGKGEFAQHTGFSAITSEKPSVNWSKSDVVISEYLKKEIEKDYTNGWIWLNTCITKNDARGIKDYFSGDLLNFVETKINAGKKLNSVITEHNLKIEHISFDYTTAIIVDSMSYYECHDLTKEISDCELKSKITRTFLNNQDGFWKAFNHETIVTNNDFKIYHTEQWEKNMLFINKIKGINYYPKNNPWNKFWNNYSEEETEHDFDIISSLGLNTVRIFISVEALGINEINDATLLKFDHLLSAAEERNLKVIPTLFDFPIGYDFYQLPVYDKQIKALTYRYKENKTILSWNLKNEADLDFEIHGKAKVLKSMNFMITMFKLLDHNHPITIGWAHPENAGVLADKLDYISVHYYKDIKELETTILALKNVNEKVVIEEFGKPSNRHIWNLFQNSEDKQAEYASSIIQKAQSEQISWMIWTLYDFSEAPVDIFGRNPIVRSSQKGLGLINHEGNFKKQAKFILKNNKN